MGVTGLWRLIEPSGKPVPLETLENKVLAVDISIWLHQAIKGFQDSRGAPLPNAHLLGIYHRVCKLLFFRIKPIFVFDGGVPALKKQTIAKRNQIKSKTLNEADKIQKQLINTLLKHSAVSKVIAEKAKINLEASSSVNTTKTKNSKDELFKLPEIDKDFAILSEEDEESESSDSSPSKPFWDLHTIDEKSPHFLSLPPEVRHEILTELKGTRKQSSWDRIHEIPKESGDFSSYQMKRLLKRFSIQSSLEEVEKEMGGCSLTLGELETLLQDQGVVSKDVGRRIASDENTRFLLIKNVKKAMEDIKNKEKEENKKKIELEKLSSIKTDPNSTSALKDEDEELQRAIQLSLQCESEVKKSENIVSETNLPNLSDSNEEEEAKVPDPKALESAKNYMKEYSGLTPNEIEKIIGSNVSNKNKLVCDDHQTSFDKNNINKEVSKNVYNETEKITIKGSNKQFISDSESSDDDFVEVTSTDHSKPAFSNNSKPVFEITIKPITETLEDDLFGDIFSKTDENKAEIETANKLTNINSETLITNVTKTVCKENENKENDVANKLEPLKITENVKLNNENNDAAETITASILEDNFEKLTRQQNTEKVVGELRKTLKNIKNNEPNENVLNDEQLKEIQENLIQEENKLFSEKSNKERLATNITDQMYQEAQELLQLFGVPYIIAPMEAEAQCAFLDLIDITDGTITDDSDIWLFGGKTVYKNFFNQSKHVLEFKSENIQHHFRLTREQMILLALLVGSDYTVGIPGIGPVTALEILAAFPPLKVTEFSLTHQELLSGLSEFRSWLTSGKTATGKTSLRNKLKNVTFTENFPSHQVVEAYLDPKVDTSKEPFSWSKPDIVALTDFAKEKFGWTRQKSEEILKPVIKKLDEKNFQKSIRDYFKTKYKLHSVDAESKMSKRVRKAVHKIGKEGSDTSDNEQDIEKKIVKKGKNKKNVNKNSKVQKCDDNDNDCASTSSKSGSVSEKNVEKLPQNENKTKKILKKCTSSKKIVCDNQEEEIDKKNPSIKHRGKIPDSTWSLSTPATEEIRKMHETVLDTETIAEFESQTMCETAGIQESSCHDSEPSTSLKRPKNDTKTNKKQKTGFQNDEEMKILEETITRSKSKVEAIRKQLLEQLNRSKSSHKETKELIRDVSGPISPLDRLKAENIHRKEVIPQKEQDRLTMMRSKVKAIEILKNKKSSKKKGKKVRMPHTSTHYLSESSSDNEN